MKIPLCLRVVLFMFLLSLVPVLPQTAGATAPEVTKFEPVDTTDLVNLTSGDFTYAVPILVVPGAPGGAYPISLNYHAGILFREEASWVGLGWNLSPGAINRAVRGLPDEYDKVLISSTENIKSNYSYTVGLGMKTWSAGVRFDNHGGFGGQVGIGFGERSSLSLSFGSYGIGFSARAGMVQLGYHTAYGASGGLIFNDQVGISYGKHTGISLSVTDKETGVSASLSSEGMSINRTFASLSLPFKRESQGSAFDIRTKGGTVNLGVFYAGIQKSEFSRTETSWGFGALALPKVKELTEHDQVEIAGEDLDRIIDDGVRFFNFDFRLANWNAAFSRYDENYSQHSSFLADYVGLDFDVFQVAAQGVTGTARPTLGKRGWVKPSDALLSAAFDEEHPEKRIHPYRFLAHKLRLEADPPWGSEYKNLFTDSNLGWQANQSGDVEMVFIDDPGYQAPVELYPDVVADGSDFFDYSGKIENRSKRIEMTEGGYRVTKADGMRYTFGIHGNGGRTVGAAPRVLQETTRSRISKRMDGGSPLSTVTTNKYGSYPYAYYLAAVESPTYLDRTGDGYSADDFGDYIYFEYTEVSPNYQWQGPWSDDLNNPQYRLTGKVGARKYQFEHLSGTKSVVVPHRAVTRTHVAVFNLGTGGDKRKDGRSYSQSGGASFGFSNIEMLPSDWSTHKVTVENGTEITFPTQTLPFALPLGMVTTQALSKEMVVSFSNGKVQYADGSVQDLAAVDATYLGAVPNSDKGVFALHYYDEFVADPSTLIITHLEAPGWSNGFAKLDSIHLYDRQKYEILMDQILANSPRGTYVPQDFAQDTHYLMKIDFEQDYALGQGMPNSVDVNQGRLTLNQVLFFDSAGRQTNPGYQFQYYTSPTIPMTDAQIYHQDPWGYYSDVSTLTKSVVSQTVDPALEGNPIQAAWSLKSIETPLGSQIRVEYQADRYHHVQDRLAIDLDSSRSTATGVLSHADTSATVAPDDLIAWDPEDSNIPDADTLVGQLTSFVFDTSGKWTQQVVLCATYTDDVNLAPPLGTNFTQRFVLPAENGQLLDSQALREFVTWFIHEQYYLAKTSSDTNQTPHRVSEFGLILLNGTAGALYPEDDLVGQPGGGLRVKQVVTSEADIADSQAYAVKYYYTRPETWVDPGSGNPIDPAVGFGSGVIFADPPHHLSGEEGADRRIIRSEEHPYQNMAGSNVSYEYVTVKTEPVTAAGEPITPLLADLALTTHRFITSRDLRINRPFASIPGQRTGTVAHLAKNTSLSEEEEMGFFGSLPIWKSQVSGQNAIVKDTERHQVRYALKEDIHRVILNNTALLGQPEEISTYEGRYPLRRLTKHQFDYAANYSYAAPGDPPAGDPPLMKKFWLDQNGKLMESDGSLVGPQGVYTEKSQALLLGGSGTGVSQVDNISAKILLVDEVFNVFRQTEATVWEYEYSDNQLEPVVSLRTSEKKNLAFDYYTGRPVLTVDRRNGTTGPVDLYQLGVSAHQLYGLQQQAGEPVMLTQEGFSLTALDDNPDQAPDPATFLDHVTQPNPVDRRARVTNASLNHWRLHPTQAGDGAWVRDAGFAFVHTDAQKNSTGWRYLNLLPDSSVNDPSGVLLNLHQAAAGNASLGFWVAPGQNTLYDHRLNVLEYRNRLGPFSSARTVRGGDLVAALFENAQSSQVYYQGFEDSGGNHTNSDFFSLAGVASAYKNTNYLTNFSSVYAGTQSHKGQVTISLQGADALTNLYGLGPPTPNTPYWLWCYATSPSAVVTVDGVVQTPTVQSVEMAWNLYQVRLDGPPQTVEIDPGTEGFVDEITLFPAAKGELGDSDYRTTASVNLVGYHPHFRKPTSMTDARGRTVRYEYHPDGELFRVYDTEGVLRKAYYRSYRNQKLSGEVPL